MKQKLDANEKMNATGMQKRMLSQSVEYYQYEQKINATNIYSTRYYPKLFP